MECFWRAFFISLLQRLSLLLLSLLELANEVPAISKHFDLSFIYWCVLFLKFCGSFVLPEGHKLISFWTVLANSPKQLPLQPHNCLCKLGSFKSISLTHTECTSIIVLMNKKQKLLLSNQFFMFVFFVLLFAFAVSKTNPREHIMDLKVIQKMEAIVENFPSNKNHLNELKVAAAVLIVVDEISFSYKKGSLFFTAWMKCRCRFSQKKLTY